ncbi:MAG: hypothetical protein E7495_06955 [Ruminococcus flavefaciens]|nr:hypothetical protein [Ruminococcus flavefaciens]
MKFESLFNDIDHDTADRISKEYPVLKIDQKERLYAMSIGMYNRVMNKLFPSDECRKRCLKTDSKDLEIKNQQEYSFINNERRS